MHSQKSSGGIWMLVGLVALLMTPVVIGHFTIASDANAQHLAALMPAAQ